MRSERYAPEASSAERGDSSLNGGNQTSGAGTVEMETGDGVIGELRTQVIQIARNPVLVLRPVDLPLILPLPDAKQEPNPEMDRTPLGKEGTTRI